MSENELLERLRAGDEAASRIFVERHGSLVFNVALSLLQNQSDAEDAAQETFVQAFRALPTFEGGSRLSTWLYRIATNKSLEMLRAKARKKRFGFLKPIFEKNSLRPAVELPDFEHPGVRLEQKERAAALFKAIEKLPENQRAAFTLHKAEDLSQAEIADIMQLSVGAVESLIFRAKQNLRRFLADFYAQNEG